MAAEEARDADLAEDELGVERVVEGLCDLLDRNSGWWERLCACVRVCRGGGEGEETSVSCMSVCDRSLDGQLLAPRPQS